MPLRNRPWIVVAGVVWSVAVLGGLAVVIDYASAPGEAGVAAAQWPSATRLERDPARPTLVMLLHPRCPCSRASVRELDRILARARGRLAVRVLFWTPEDASRDWEETDLWRSVRALPGVVPAPDPEGREARLFGAKTSGHTVVYDAAGRLRFRGGITAGRGHGGDNHGSAAILSLLDRGAAERDTTTVYGCPLVAARAP